MTLADEQLFLGRDLLPWLMLAIGAALVVANIAAVIRPPLVDPASGSGERRAPASLRRVVPFILVGLLVSVWALASLLSS